MPDSEEFERTLKRLNAATSASSLSAVNRAHALDLYSRLKTGVRVVVLGSGGSGKSTLCKALINEEVPAHEPEETTFVYVRAGANPGIDFVPEAGPPICIDAEFLQDICLIDIHLPTEPAAFSKATQDAFELADIVLWCSQSFAANEAEIWAEAPDHLKDHSFLVLTKADELMDAGQLKERIDALQYIVSEEFHSMFPTSAKSVEAVLSSGGTPDAAQRSASGMTALCETVRRIAASGRRADLDSALLFLERHSVEAFPQKETSENPTRYWGPGLEKVRALISEHAEQLVTIGSAGDEETDRVFDICNSLSEALSDAVSENDTDCTGLRDWEDELIDASDRLVLMGLENDTRSAADAVSIVVQLSRDLQLENFVSNPR